MKKKNPNEPELVRNHDGKVVGKIYTYDDKRIFKLKRRGSKHMIREPRLAWALDQNILEKIHRQDVGMIEIYDKDTHATYWVHTITMVAKGETFDRGYGLQVKLELPYWACSRDDTENYFQENLFQGAGK